MFSRPSGRSGGDFAKFCGLLRIYELYMQAFLRCFKLELLYFYEFVLLCRAVGRSDNPVCVGGGASSNVVGIIFSRWIWGN